LTRSILFVAATLLSTSACRDGLPGPETNVASRSAFAAQRDRARARTPSFDADRALAPSWARRGTANQAAGEPGGSTPAATPTMEGAGGAWAGAKGTISLEAK